MRSRPMSCQYKKASTALALSMPRDAQRSAFSSLRQPHCIRPKRYTLQYSSGALGMYSSMKMFCTEVQPIRAAPCSKPQRIIYSAFHECIL